MGSRSGLRWHVRSGTCSRRRQPLRSFPICVFSVSDSLNLDDVGIAEYLVDDAVIPDADSASALGTRELLRTVRERIIRELADGGYDACHLVTRQTANVLPGGVAPLNLKASHRA